MKFQEEGLLMENKKGFCQKSVQSKYDYLFNFNLTDKFVFDSFVITKHRGNKLYLEKKIRMCWRH